MRRISLGLLAALMLLAAGCTRQAVSVPAPSQPTQPTAPVSETRPLQPRTDYATLTRRVEQLGDYFENQPEGGMWPSWIGVDEENHLVAYGRPMFGRDGIYSNARDWFKQADIQLMIAQETSHRFDATPAPAVAKPLYVISRSTYESWPASGAAGSVDLRADEATLFGAGPETRTTMLQTWVKQRTGDRFVSAVRQSSDVIVTLKAGQLSETERMAEASKIAAYTLLLMQSGGADVRYTGASRIQSLSAASYDMAGWFTAGAKVGEVPTWFEVDGGNGGLNSFQQMPLNGVARAASLPALLEQRAEWKQYFPADAKLTIGLYVNDHREAVMLVEAPVAQSASLEAAVADYQHAAEKLLDQAPGLGTVQLLLRQGDQLAFQSVEWTDLQMAKLVGAQLSPDRMKPMGPIPTLFRIAKSQ